MKAIWQKIVKHKKWLLLAVVLAVAVKGGLAWQASSKAKAATNVQTAAAIRGDVTSLVSATGTIKPVNMVDVSSKITGLIKETKVEENDAVKAGQVLIVLDDSRLQAQVTQARERLANAQSNFERNSRLNKIGAVSDQQLDASRMEYKVAQANYDEAASQLADTVIRAPIDGVVIGKPIPAGQTVAQGLSNPMVILTVADLSKMQIETQVDESDIGKVAVGQKATFTVDAYPGKVFTGVVSSVSQKATIQQNVVYYGVIIDVDAGDRELKPTMTARVSVAVGESKNALTVPLAAVKTNKNQQYVVVMKNGQATNVNITTGLSSDDRVEITGGLTDGDQVVVSQSKPQKQQQRGGMMIR
ncbi:efflux RND transporter periplasmic adaptor subunit [Anaeroselena agilis]|uniref:Efflux RND transporter periplasmic adaptor subunit n=1 Tax=Anaeroselena agilis TaxID=3063788 RepID=A0ABU3P0G8_9FIRM|nr:efflux RND transporter periplasmic adaptor subunit [Selenomonadales bacterium 4137-cl]